MSRPSEYGYLFLVPEAMTKAEYMLRMYEDCIFPALIRERDALPKVPGAPKPRIRHFMDGDHGPLQAINSMMDMLEAQLIDCIKSSAGTSAIEQANDAMRAFMMLRKLLKSWRYVYNEQEYQAHPIGTYVTVAMEAIIRATDLSAEKARIQAKAVVVAERARVAALTPEERAAEAKVVHDAKEEHKAAVKQEKDVAKEKEVAGKKAAKDAAKKALRAAALVQRAAAAAVAEAAEPKAPKQRKRGADEAAASAAPRKKAAVTYYCANPFCETTSVTAESWSMCGRCPQDLARGWFCPSDACQAMLAAHELICTK